MARIAFLMPAYRSHAAVHGALAAELSARGHQAIFVGPPSLAPHARREGTGFQPFPGPADAARIGGGLPGFVRLLRDTARATRAHATGGPQALGRARADIAVVDEMEPGGSLAAEAAGVPRVTLAASLPLRRDPGVPPPYVGWDWREGEDGVRRAQGAWRVSDWLMTAQRRALADGCRMHGLPVRDRPSDWVAAEGSIAQWIAALDFPRPVPVGPVVGPIRRPTRPDGPPPFGGAPYVFASLGTIAGGRLRLFRVIAQAARRAGTNLALAHCDGLSETEAAALAAIWPGHIDVRAYFDQLPTIAGASAVVTHGGLNTVLDAAGMGVPMVALPLGNDQNGIAARLTRAGAAIVLPPRRATPERLAQALAAVTTDPRYRTALDPARAEIAGAGGARAAADAVEAALGRVR